MKLETFFEKFDQLADAPEAVAKMRELVLQLAVQGKLVEQRHSELPASENIRKANRPLVDVIFDESKKRPTGWAALPLGCLVASNTGGGTPSKGNPAYWNGPIPWASVKDIQSAKYLTSTIDSITEAGLKNSSSNLIPVGRLLVVTRMGLGKLAINKVPVTINQDLRAIAPTTALDLDFAYLLFKSLKIVGSGMTVKGITVEKLHAMPVLLPPLAEQERIVAKVDELMAQCDRLEEQLKARDEKHAVLARAALVRFAESPTTANLQLLFHDSFAITPADLRKTIIDVASRGAFPPSVFSGKPVREALAIRRSERKQAWLKMKGRNNAYKEPDRVQYDEFPMLPKHWGLEYLGLLGTDPFDAVQTGPFGSQLLKTEFVESGVPVVAVGNLTGLGFSSKRLYHITQEKAEQLSRYDVQAGDLLFARTGATLGKVCLAPDEAKDWRMTGHILRVRLHRDIIDPRLVVLFLWASDFVKSQVSGGIRGMTRPGFNTGLLERILIPIPPTAEQRRIVKRVDELMVLVDRLETQLTATRATAANLLSALIAELTGTPSNSKVSTPSGSSTGRRGRPRKSQ